jgi:hypothetical protein
VSTASATHVPFGRIAYAALTALLLGALILEAAAHGLWTPAVLGMVAPDLALLAGAGAGLAHGQLHPRAVPAYNLVHRHWLPLMLMAAATAGLLGTWWFVAGLAWALHVSLDRAVGYGLRTREGFQRAG